MRIIAGPLPYDRVAVVERRWQRVLTERGFALFNVKLCCDGRREGEAMWTLEAAIAAVAALVERLDLGTRYPSRPQLAANGLSGLDSAITRRLGGHQAFAPRLGLSIQRRRWALEEAERAASKLVRELGAPRRYPSPAEFYEAGQSGLFQAIEHQLGGHAEFAKRLGVTRQRPGWDVERLEASIMAVVDAADTGRCYPTPREMRRYGPPGLEEAARRLIGAPELARRLGLQMTRTKWDCDRAAAAVVELADRLDLRGRYPTQKQFDAAGLSGLRSYITGHDGGHAAFAARIGLSLAPPGGSAKHRPA